MLPSELSPPGPKDVLPPVDPRRTAIVAGAGLACALLAAILAVISGERGAGDPRLIDTVRLILSAGGLLATGTALSWRPTVASSWGFLAVAAGIVGWLSLPHHWDSYRLVAKVVFGLSATAAIWTLLPLGLRAGFGVLAVLFHFSAILTATLMPPSTPWFALQLSTRVYHPYSSFMYLTNAYHFYSPDPGPAYLLFVLLKYEVEEKGTKRPASAWVKIPNRANNFHDPMGQTYFRRLSATNGIASTSEVMEMPRENLEARQARTMQKAIPYAPPDHLPELLQYRPPSSEVPRDLLPGYARHLAEEYAAPGQKILSMKMYLVEHRLLSSMEYVAYEESPYAAYTYRPYYMGEYDRTGKLVDPHDPLLYWLIPVTQKYDPPAPPDPNRPLDRQTPTQNFYDALSDHAGSKFEEWGRK